jgi:Putative MetA-pathway of phenol degradation
VRSFLVTACAGMLFVLSAQAQESPLTLGAGVHYSSGDYGSATDTRIMSFAATARYETGLWVYKATLPYLSVKGDTNVIPGVGQVGGAAVRSDSASGLGDIVLSATYAAYYDKATTLGMDLTAKLKLATADESKGLGTGKHDVVLLLDLYRTFDRITGFGGIGYHILGDSPAFPLENAWSANLGASYKLDERDSAGAMLEGRQRVVAGGARQRELVGFFTRKLDHLWKAQVYALLGFADGSPDWGAGLSFARPF